MAIMIAHLQRMFRRSGQAHRAGRGCWEKLAADIIGPLDEVLWRIFALLLLSAAIIPFLRGQPWDSWVGRLFAAIAGVAILALLASRIVRTTYLMTIWRFGTVRLVICPVAATFFLVDVLWLATGAVWLHASTRPGPAAPAPDRAFDFGGPAILLTVSAALLGLRVWSRAQERMEFR
jgi:hypothetical protein